MCLQESSSEFEVVNMEEKTLSETQTVSFLRMFGNPGQWQSLNCTCMNLCVFFWIIAPFRTFCILSFCAADISHVTDSSQCSCSAVSLFLPYQRFIRCNESMYLYEAVPWMTQGETPGFS